MRNSLQVGREREEEEGDEEDAANEGVKQPRKVRVRLMWKKGKKGVSAYLGGCESEIWAVAAYL